MEILYPDQILALSDESRKRLRLRRCRRGRQREKRERLTREGLIGYLRDNGFNSSRKLSDGRNPGEPTVSDCRREFGSWQKAKDAAFAKDFRPDVTANYLMKTVLFYGIETYDEYIAKREELPEIVPSFRSVRKYFDTWGNLKECADRKSLQEILEKYRRLVRTFGRFPSVKDVERKGKITIKEAMAHFDGDKKKLDAFVREMGGTS